MNGPTRFYARSNKLHNVFLQANLVLESVIAIIGIVQGAEEAIMRLWWGVLAGLLIIACQAAPKGGGGGYQPRNQPALNPYATPDSMVGGGRVPQEVGGMNSGAHQPTAEGGVRGSGSTYYPMKPTPKPSHAR